MSPGGVPMMTRLVIGLALLTTGLVSGFVWAFSGLPINGLTIITMLMTFAGASMVGTVTDDLQHQRRLARREEER